jgi:putative ABC transport system permease protein
VARTSQAPGEGGEKSEKALRTLTPIIALFVEGEQDHMEDGGMYRIALKMLFGDRAKFFGIVAGLTFAALLIIQQAGLFFGLLERSYSGIRDVPAANVWVMDPQSKLLDDIKPMLDRELHRVRGVAGVLWAVPYYRGGLTARLSDGRLQDIFLIGLDDTTLTGGPYRMVQGQLLDLRASQAVIVDRAGAEGKLARPASTPGGPRRPLAVGDTLEINDQRAVVVGLAEGPRIWGDNPVIYTTYSRAFHFTPAQRRRLSYILVRTAPGHDPAAVCRRIGRATGLAARTADELRDLTVTYMLHETAIPMLFGVSVAFGFLIGTAIAGQMFYNFTIENLRHFGTLKALGLSNMALARMVLLQALTVGVIGWSLGLGLASAIGWQMRGTDLGFLLPWHLFVGSLAAILLISAGAALLSLRRVVRLEPAIVFRG